MDKGFNDKLIEKTEKYPNLTSFIRIIINNIPYIGNSIDIFVSDKIQIIKEKRILSLIDELARQIEDIHENLIDYKYLDSEEWYDLLFSAFEKAIKTRSEEKIKYYANILKTSVIDVDIRKQAEDFINVLSELSEIEINIAKIISEHITISINENPRGDEGLLNQFLQDCNFVDAKDLQFYLKRLEKSGLVNEIVGMYLGYSGGIYEMTATFSKILKLL